MCGYTSSNVAITDLHCSCILSRFREGNSTLHRFQGVKPASFDKVQNPEIKDVIESCIKPRKEDRPKVKDLLNHAFFEEDVGLKVEVVSQESTKIVFRLRVIDPKKRTHKHKENEAIQFEYDLETDKYTTIVEEMVSDVFFYTLQ